MNAQRRSCSWRPGLLAAALLVATSTASPSSGGRDRGTLVIESDPPGAAVFVRTGGINGYAPAGRTPRTLRGLAPGLLEYTLLHAGRQLHDGSVWIESGGRHAEKIRLRRGRVFFVDGGHASADDANPGTEGKPWKTIRHAADVLVAGDTVLVKSGRYHEQWAKWHRGMWATPNLIPARAGEPGAPITFRAYPGCDVFVTNDQGGGLGNGRAYTRWVGLRTDRRVIFWNARHSALIDCEIIGQYKPTTDNHDGIRIEHSRHITVRNCVIRGVRGNSWNSAGIKCYDVRRLLVEHCDIRNCFSCVYDKDSGKHNVYRFCLLRDPQAEPRPGHPNFHMHTHGGESTDGVEVYHNVIAGGGVYYNTANVREPFRVHNNTFVRAALGSKGGAMLEMFNNVFLGEKVAGYREIKNTESAPSDHNLFWPAAELRFGVYTPRAKTYRGLAAWRRERGTEQHSIVADPQLVDPAKRDLRLRAGSPCIDAGRPMTYAAGKGSDADTIAVRCAWSFFPGDVVHIGRGKAARRAAVVEVLDRAHLKLDRRVSWTDGASVTLPFAGRAPDIGAFEHAETRRVLGPTWRRYPRRDLAGAQGAAGPRPTATGPVKADTAPAPRKKYVPLHREDWRSYASNEELFAKRRWWNFTRGEEWKEHIRLVPDRTFKQVVRMTQPRQADDGNRRRVGRTFFLTQKFARPLASVWVRFTVRFSPGFDLQGTTPPKANAAYKLFFLLFEGAGGRTGIELANRRQYIYTNLQGGFRRESERSFGTHRWGGHIAGEFTDGEWYEFVVHREVTGPRSYVNRFYRRRRTGKGRIVEPPWNFWGIETLGKPGQVARPARAIQLGGNKNKSNDRTQHVTWGPWEVVDASEYPNPYSLPLK